MSRIRHEGEGHSVQKTTYSAIFTCLHSEKWVCEDEEDMISVFKELQVQWGQGEVISKRKRSTVFNATER